jgi:hypothetical protein
MKVLNISLNPFIRIGNFKLSLRTRLFAGLVHDRYGVTNICKDGMRCNFIDFDTNSLIDGCNKGVKHDYEKCLRCNDWCISNIIESCKENQDRFMLGNYYIIQSYPRLSFHAINLDKITLAMDRMILANTLYADLWFVMTYSEQYRGFMPHTPNHKVLRVLPKEPDEEMRLIKTVESPHNDKNVKSRMHSIYFHRAYDIPFQYDCDDSNMVELKFEVYESRS